jgi:hypothetical protein
VNLAGKAYKKELTSQDSHYFIKYTVIIKKNTDDVAQLFWARMKDIKAILRYKNFQRADPAQF